MAYADYRLCDVCGAKTFYDASLNYNSPNAEHPHYWLYGVGDWVVICVECAKKYTCEAVPRARSTEDNANG